MPEPLRLVRPVSLLCAEQHMRDMTSEMRSSSPYKNLCKAGGGEGTLYQRVGKFDAEIKCNPCRWLARR